MTFIDVDESDLATAAEMVDGEPVREEPLTGARLLESFVDYHNIAEDLEKDERSPIGGRVKKEYDIDESSRTEWKESMEKGLDLARQVKSSKNYPWPNAANVKFPLITTASIQFAARAYPAIVPGRNMVKGKVIGSDKGVPLRDQQGQVVMEPPTAEGGEPQPRWAVKPGDKQRRADRVGSHMSYQLLEEMEDWEGDTDVLLSVLPVVGCVFRKTKRDIARNINTSEMCLPQDVCVNNNAKSLDRAQRITYKFELYPHEIEERVRNGSYIKIENLGVPEGAGDDDDAPHVFLEQCRFLDMDDDGLGEPYTVTIHEETQEVVRIEARFEASGIETNEEGHVTRVVPINYYTKYGFLPCPKGGFYDFGFGRLLGPINGTINTALNAMLDAGHLQNAGGGFVRQDLRVGGISKGTFKFRPGEFKGVEVAGGASLSDSVMPFRHPGPSAVMFSLLGFLVDAGKDMSSVKDVLMGGTPGGKVVPPTTMLAMIEQGQQVFTSIYKRIHRALKHEFKLLFRLNSLYMDDKVYFRLMDDEQSIEKSDYAMDDMDIVPVSDPKEVSDMQRMGRAEFLMSFRDDPLVNQIEIRRRAMEAGSIPDIDALLIPPQPDPMMERMAQIELADRESAITERGFKAGMDADKTLAEIMLINAKAIGEIAKAEAAEDGTQLGIYKAEIEAITTRAMANATNTRGVRGVEGRPNNQ